MVDRAMRIVCRLRADEGQTMVEYGLILTFISLVAIAILQTLGTNIQPGFSSASSAL